MRRYVVALLSMVVLAVTLMAGQAGANIASSEDAEDAPGWLVNAQGLVQTVGAADHFGDLASYTLNSPIVGIAPTPFGEGYWLLAADGGLFAFGDAGFYGSMGGLPLASPVVALASTATGEGYWMVAADGGIFAFGDARFWGSMGGIPLNSPIVAITATPSGEGYWLVAADGGIFAFGDAEFFGSMGEITLNSPVVGIAPAPEGNGYWLVGADGGIFSFGASEFFGSTALEGVEISGLAPTPSGDGYQIFSKDGRIFGFGSAPSNPNKSDVGSVMGVAPRPNRKRGDRERDKRRKGGGSGVTTTTRPRTTTTKQKRRGPVTTIDRPTTTQVPTTLVTTTTSTPPTTTTTSAGSYPTNIKDPVLKAERDAAAAAACHVAYAATSGSTADKQAACQAAASVAWAAKKQEQLAIIASGGGSAPTTTTVAATTTTVAATTTTAPPTGGGAGVTTTTVGNTSMTYPSAGSTAAERAYNALGIYKGGSKASNIESHERWMGRKSNYWTVFLSDDFASTLNVLRSNINSSDSKFLLDERTIIMSLDLTPRRNQVRSENATELLTDAKNGVNDWFWEELGRVLVDEGLTGYWPDGRPKVILRIAWEHNGNWFPWSSRPGRDSLFRAAFRRAVKRVESTAGEVTVAWGSETLQNTAANLNASYPGDDVVDIIEVDVYDSYGGYAPNPYGTTPNIAKRDASWNMRLNGSPSGLTGLTFFADFAREHNKGFAIGEFGLFQLVKNGEEVGGGDNAQWIQRMFDFVGAQENLVYVSYFEVMRSGSRHRLSPEGYVGGNGATAGSEFPLAAAKFLELWGNI